MGFGHLSVSYNTICFGEGRLGEKVKEQFCAKPSAYPQAYLEDMGMGKRYTQWILSGFKFWLKGDVCEVGAGTGNISRHLLALGIKRLVFLEPDKRLFETLGRGIKGTPSICLSNSTLDEYSTINKEQFDTFLYINVLEHIEKDEDELQLMHSLLRRGGAALIFVPALQGLFSRYDKEVGHWRRYSKKELRYKIERVGFELEEIRYFDFFGIFIWFVACRVFGFRPSAGNVGLYDRILVPVSSRLERFCRPLIGKNLLAVAVKR